MVYLPPSPRLSFILTALIYQANPSLPLGKLQLSPERHRLYIPRLCKSQKRARGMALVRAIRARHVQRQRPNQFRLQPYVLAWIGYWHPRHSHRHALTDPICLDAHHRFIAEECDWGFTRFHDLRKLFTGIEGRRPIIENDEAEITVFVRVLKDPTGVLWHNFVK
jgi:hypothetical protein